MRHRCEVMPVYEVETEPGEWTLCSEAAYNAAVEAAALGAVADDAGQASSSAGYRQL